MSHGTIDYHDHHPLAVALATGAGEPNPASKPVVFESSDLELQQLHDSATERIQRHLNEYAPGVRYELQNGELAQILAVPFDYPYQPPD